MVDIISSAKGLRQSGSARYGALSGSPNLVARAIAVSAVTAPNETGQREQENRKEKKRPRESVELAKTSGDLRLEISASDGQGEFVYRFVDAQTGSVVSEWNSDRIGQLRDYVREKNIQLYDKKV